MKPYWQSADGTITVYHAPFELVLASGAVPVEEVALIHDDPPYGQGERTARASAGRGLQAGTKAPRTMTGKDGQRGTVRGIRDFPPIPGDDRPYDPADVLALGRPTVTWGAQRYAHLLPPSPSWFWWAKKRDPQTGETDSDDNGDGELAWSNLGGPPREWSHMWRGALRETEKVTVHRHPTQKPIALSLWVFEERAKLKPLDLVFVPHGGSGPDLPAARAMGLRLIWCDVEQWCCDTAIARLPEAPPAILERAKAFQLATRKAKPEAACGPLFGGAR